MFIKSFPCINTDEAGLQRTDSHGASRHVNDSLMRNTRHLMKYTRDVLQIVVDYSAEQKNVVLASIT